MRSENISTPIYVECDKMYGSKVCVQESRISCLALIFNLKNQSTTVLYAKKSVAGGEIQQVIHRFFRAIDTNRWLSGYYWLRLVAEGQRLGFDY